MHCGSPSSDENSSSVLHETSAGTSGTNNMPCEEYSCAMLAFEELVEQYEIDVSQLTEASVVISEAKLTRALCRVLISRPPTIVSRQLLSDWLRPIGFSASNIRHLELCGVTDVHTLLMKSEKEIKSLAERGRYSNEMKRRLIRSTEVAWKYLEALKTAHEHGDQVTTFSDKQLSWSVYSPISGKKSISSRAASAESSSPPSPRFIVSRLDGQCSGVADRVSSIDGKSEFCGSIPGATSIPYTAHSLTASASGSLSVLSGRAKTLSPPSPLGGSAQSTPTLGVSSRVVHSSSMQFGALKSPKPPSRLVHAIPHKWHRTTKFRLNSDSVCHFCQRPLGFGFLHAWEKCRSCKWKVHTHCKSRIGDSCGLTPEHLRRLFDKLIQQNNGDMWNDPQSAVPMSRSLNEPAFQYPDSVIGIGDSSSSTNSSAPSTPALPLGLGPANSPYNLATAPSRSSERKFTFPDAVPEVPDIVLPEMSEDRPSGWIENTGSEGFEGNTAIGSRLGEGSEGTLVVDSTGSGTDTAASEGSTGGRSPNSQGHTWDRHRWNMSTIRGPNAQASWNEVTIPFQKIDFKKNSLIGRGRFGDVVRGYHFGDVAVKFLNMDHIDEYRRLEEFKSEVAAHKNTRHDNIVLFLGYCLEQDKLGIVMSLCKGRPLYQVLHESSEKLDLSTSLLLATQICQGVSYLHTKKILHKDLRSKNIFIESKNKVVITDFGLFSMKRLRNPHRNNTMVVPQNWLVYLAPEIMRALSADFRELPFSESTDVYAFSTIWFELLTYSFPFTRESSDRVIWMVGNGMKSPLHNINAGREVKELLLRCWSYLGSDRPSFSDILTLLNSLPKKRLERSPSFPAIRSFESMF